MKKLIMMSILLVLSNVAFAEVGPLTAATQKYFAETGQCYIKYHDYSQAKMSQSVMQNSPKMKGGFFGISMAPKAKKDGKLQPSTLFEFTKGEAGEANKREGIGIFKSKYMPGTWNIIRNEKFYILNTIIKSTEQGDVLLPTNKKGIRKDLKDCTEGERATSGLNALPVALALTLPDSMLPLGNNKYIVKQYKYDGSTTVETDGTTFQCEQYSLTSIPDKMSPFETMQVKLLFNDGKLTKFEERSIQYDVELTNTFNKNLTTIPAGYTIYADTRGSMNALINKDVVLEKY